MRGKKLKAAVSLALSIVLATPTAAAFAPATTVEAAAKVKLNATKKTLNVGKTYTLKLKNAKGKVTWKSSKKSVATVTSKGKVKAVAAGTATITATNKKKSYKCKITVKNPKKPDNTPKTVTVGPVKLTYPGNFIAESAEVDGSYAWVAADSKDTKNVTQMLTVKMQYTGEEAYDYDMLLGIYEAQLSEETLKSTYETMGVTAKISNYELSSYDSKLGKAIRVSYHLSVEAEGEKAEEDAVCYLIGIDDYIVEIDGEALNGGKIDAVDGYAKALLDTMVVL